jgi:amino acid transporter
VDPQFQRALIVVVVAGTVVFTIGAVVLWLAFRAFGQKEGERQPPFVLIGTVVAFVFACCFVLFFLTFATGR